MEHQEPSIWVYVAFSVIGCLALLAFALKASGRADKRNPNWWQNAGEQLFESFEMLTVSVVGEHGRKYTPLIGTLFLYILVSNLIGLIPASTAPTASLNTTIALALIVFVYVQYEGIRANGLIGYLKHFGGVGVVPFWMVPLMFVIEVIGELAKPFSLAVRLYGNMFGKEKVIIALIVTFGVPLMRYYIPLPIQLPILLFGVLVSFVQAFVFALLAGIYLSLMTEHAAHGHRAGESH